MYYYTGDRAVRLLPISISLIRSLSLAHTAPLPVSLSYILYTVGRAVRVFFSLPRLARTRVRLQSLPFVLSPARSLARMAAGLVAVAQPFRIAVFAGFVRRGRLRVLV